MTSEQKPAPVALLVWATLDHGIRSTARALAGILAGDPHGFEALELDLARELAGPSLVGTLAAWSGPTLGAAFLASRGWPLAEARLAGRMPRVVVALDPQAAAVVDAWRAEGRIVAPLVGVLCGLRVDPAWAKTALDRLSVADEVQAEAAHGLGLPAEALVPCGIPVCGGFSSIDPDDKEPLRRRFEIPLGPPVVLFVAEGVESDQVTGALLQLSLLEDRATLLFDVARADEAADLLRRRAVLYGVQARMFGKVEQAGELWAASDLVVARHHIFVEERALALRLPYVHLWPQGEAAEQTASVYVTRGIGRVATHVATLAAELELGLAAPALAEARQRLGAVSRRSAATEVGRLVAQVAAQAEQILAERYRRPTPGSDAEAATPSTRGPLELIGGPAAAGAPEHVGIEDIEAAEAEANRQVTEHQREADLWTRRAALARERGEGELAAEADRLAEHHAAAMHRALAELARLTERRGVAEGQPRRDARLERTFRRLEVDEELARLKRKLRGE